MQNTTGLLSSAPALTSLRTASSARGGATAFHRPLRLKGLFDVPEPIANVRAVTHPRRGLPGRPAGCPGKPGPGIRIVREGAERRPCRERPCG